MRFIGQILLRIFPSWTLSIKCSTLIMVDAMSKLHVLLQKLFSIFLFGSIYLSLFYRYLDNGMVWRYASAHLNIKSNCVSFKPDRFCRIWSFLATDFHKQILYILIYQDQFLNCYFEISFLTSHVPTIYFFLLTHLYKCLLCPVFIDILLCSLNSEDVSWIDVYLIHVLVFLEMKW